MLFITTIFIIICYRCSVNSVRELKGMWLFYSYCQWWWWPWVNGPVVRICLVEINSHLWLCVCQARVRVLEQCAETIKTAERLSTATKAGVVQAGCASLWNICLPLLQPNLRRLVRRPLTVAANALDNIDRWWSSYC